MNFSTFHAAWFGSFTTEVILFNNPLRTSMAHSVAFGLIIAFFMWAVERNKSRPLAARVGTKPMAEPVFQVTEIRLPAFGHVVKVDATLPPDVLEFRDGVTGRVLGRITNLEIEKGMQPSLRASEGQA